jgi:hypothetical protein
MLFLMMAWVGWLLTCWLIGAGILNEVKADCFERNGIDSSCLSQDFLLIT